MGPIIAAAERAYSKGNKEIVKEIMKIIVFSDIDLNSIENQKNMLIIIRCLVHLLDQSMVDSCDPEKSKIFQQAQGLLQKALTLMKGLEKQHLDIAEADWFTKVSWNFALSSDESNELTKSSIFYGLVISFSSLLDDSDNLNLVLYAYYASITKLIELARREPSEQDGHINSAKELLGKFKILPREKILNSIPDLDSTIILLELEVDILTFNWSKITTLAQNVFQSSSIEVIKGICNKVVLDQDVPSGVIYIVVKVSNFFLIA
jgi:hypothetical protein